MQHQVSSFLRQGRCCRTSENDSTSVKPSSVRETRDDGRRKVDDDDDDDGVGVVVFLASSATPNETTPEFLPNNPRSTSEIGKLCGPHSDMGLFKHPMIRLLKLGGHTPQGKE